jgi:hypothetical protein
MAATCTPQVLIAHRQPWLVDTATVALREALGITVAEQPDLLVVGDALERMTPAELVAQVCVHCLDGDRGAGAVRQMTTSMGCSTRVRVAVTHQLPPAELVDAAIAALCDGSQLA